MDSRTDFEDEERFFESYDAAHAGAEESLASAGWDDTADQPPNAQQLAHVTRFRRPVAWAVSALSLFSIAALALHSSARDPQRELVAHYFAALPAERQTEAVTVAETIVVSEPSSAANVDPLTFAMNEIGSLFEPVAATGSQTRAVNDSRPDSGTDSGLVVAFASALTRMCLLRANSEVTPLLPSDRVGIAGPPALDLCLAPGQAHNSWSLPLSTTWSSPSVRP